MRIVLLCATKRGCRFLQKLAELCPEDELIVFSFKEKPWEPAYFSEIRELTLAAKGNFFEAKNVGGPRWKKFWESTTYELMFSVSWRYMVPPSVYERSRVGAFVFHDSLLPKYRGFSPTVWAVVNGEEQTGVTLFEMAKEVDAGDITDQEVVPIGPDDIIQDIMNRVTEKYLEIFGRNIEKLKAGQAKSKRQDHSQATYTCKFLPEDAQIDWSAPTEKIYNLIRGYSKPYPGAFTFLSGRKLTVLQAQRLTGFENYAGRVSGRVVKIIPGDGAVVLTGDGGLLIKKVQIGARETVCATDLLTNLNLTLGW